MFRSLFDLISSRFQKQSKTAILWECLAMVVIIGYFDYVFPYEISMTIFYVLPILLAVWFTDKKSSDLVALCSIIISWWTDELTMPPHLLGWLHTYRMVVRLFFFLFISAGGSALRTRRDMSRSQIELLEHTQQLEREIIRISEREQQRIGQDLHDGLCQYLAAISCAASLLRNDLQKKSLPQETQSAAEIAELLKQGVTQTRNLSRGLFPVQMDEAGLESALRELAASSSHLLNIECKFEPGKHVPVYDNAAATHLYRITQEALNNATRHGHATKVAITIAEEADDIILSITDNGSGLPRTNGSRNGHSGGMGLKIMDYRARLIGGELKIKNNPEGGVTVACRFRQSPDGAPLTATAEPS